MGLPLLRQMICIIPEQCNLSAFSEKNTMQALFLFPDVVPHLQNRGLKHCRYFTHCCNLPHRAKVTDESAIWNMSYFSPHYSVADNHTTY